MPYVKLTLPNGARILRERVPGARSAALGVWIASGSRHESAAESGAAHFIEHMVFKGTRSRTASQLAARLDELGGQVDAFTSREYTCFHGRTLDSRLRQLADIFGDMLFNSNFDEDDVVNERGVILEEIDMYEDAPEDVVSDRMFSAVFRGNGLARPILGKRSTLSRMDGQFLRDRMARVYRGGDVVIALAGGYARGDAEYAAKVFSAFAPGGNAPLKAARYTPSITVKRKNIEQNHFCVSFPCARVTDDRRYATQLLSDILGGGMSSRLFQSVREARGLCYGIYTQVSSFRDTGLFSICTALGSRTQDDALSLIADELGKLVSRGVTDDELSRAREQVRTNILLGLESTVTRMNRLARGELYFGRVQEADEVVAAYEAVTAGDVRELAAEIFDSSLMSLSAAGKVGDGEHYADLLRF
ncbi:MAG: insulinase family protein [Oscillospiraceae bacterium]|jgi:predicted Zn-dependent peptidase|nr:insulinase family protein [Oscillospiraceae bacterium]